MGGFFSSAVTQEAESYLSCDGETRVWRNHEERRRIWSGHTFREVQASAVYEKNLQVDVSCQAQIIVGKIVGKSKNEKMQYKN
jgi:hypothetical protein